MTPKEIEEQADRLLDKPLFVVRVNYKSGNHVICCFHSFDIEKGNWEWTKCVDIITRTALRGVNNVVYSPVLLGPENIESVWQIQTYVKTSHAINRGPLIDHLKVVNNVS